MKNLFLSIFILLTHINVIGQIDVKVNNLNLRIIKDSIFCDSLIISFEADSIENINMIIIEYGYKEKDNELIHTPKKISIKKIEQFYCTEFIYKDKFVYNIVKNGIVILPFKLIDKKYTDINYCRIYFYNTKWETLPSIYWNNSDKLLDW